MSVAKLYVVYDRIAEQSGPVFEAKNNNVAIRKFTSMLQDEKVLNKDDYDLLCIGQIDHDSNVSEGSSVPDIIQRGTEVWTMEVEDE